MDTTASFTGVEARFTLVLAVQIGLLATAGAARPSRRPRQAERRVSGSARGSARALPRVAIVHEWLTIPGGSEQVVLELLEMFPNAELFTSIYDPAPWPAAITERPVHASPLNRIPGASRHYPKLLPLMDWAFRSFDLSGFDLVLSSNHACAKNVRTPAEHAARLLLPHADALRVGGGIPGWRGHGRACAAGAAAAAATPATAGSRRRRIPRPVHRQLPPRGGAHRSATTGARPRSSIRRSTSSTSWGWSASQGTSISCSDGWFRTSESTSR